MGWRKTTAAAIGGVLITLVTTFLGLMLVFSDLPASESAASRIAKIALTYALGCGLVGTLLPRAWYVASITALGPFLLAAVGVVGKLTQGGPYPYWSNLFMGLVLIPAAALAFAFAGSRLRRKLAVRAVAGR